MIEILEKIIESQDITLESAVFRILISFVVGMLIGFEREAHNQPAGLRTHILISVGSALVMMISIYIPQTFTNFQNGDPGRIAAQVVSGIGFLGAGAILRFGADVKGLTTAASIWAMAALGLAVGAGMYGVAFAGAVCILFALTVMDQVEKRIFKERTLRKIEIQIKKKHTDIPVLKEHLRKMDVRVISTGFERNINEANDKITFHVGVTRNMNVQKLGDMLENLPGVVAFSVEFIN